MLRGMLNTILFVHFYRLAIYIDGIYFRLQLRTNIIIWNGLHFCKDEIEVGASVRTYGAMCSFFLSFHNISQSFSLNSRYLFSTVVQQGFQSSSFIRKDLRFQVTYE